MGARGLAAKILGVSVLLAGVVLLGGVVFMAGRRSVVPPAAPLSMPVASVPPAPLPTPPPPPPPTAAELRIATMRNEAIVYSRLEGRELEDALDAWAGDAVEVTYGMLERNPDAHLGDPVVFSGRVLEIRDLPDGGTFLRVGVGSYGSDPLWIETFVPPDESIVTDTRVRVYGYLWGPHTYTSEAGWNITIPSMIGMAVVRRR